MKLTILGNNSALPAFGRHPTSQTVSVYSEVLMLDCGEGTQSQMQRYGVKWRHMHHIFISHLHGDHYFGLPGLLNSMSLQGRTSALNLYAPAPLQPILQSILDVADSVLAFELIFHPLPEGVAVLIDEFSFSVTCFPVIHRITCHGFLIEKKSRGRRILPDICKAYDVPMPFYDRLKQGEDYINPDGTIIKNDVLTGDPHQPKRYAYCADTIFTDSYIEIVRNVDTIYHESTYLDMDVEKAVARFHSTSSQAAQLAKLAGAKQLILGHFSSKYKELEPFREEASRVFPNVLIGTEGITYDI